MQKLFIVVSVVALAGCAPQPKQPAPVSLDPKVLRVSEEKPAGYPKEFIERLPSGHCELVHQDWRPGDYNGHRLWFRNESRQTVACPAGI